MDFKHDLPPTVSTQEKSTPPTYTSTASDPTPSYTSTPRTPRLYWTPERCASRDLVLHILSLIFAAHTLAFYVYDLHETLSYHVHIPVGLVVVSSLSLASSALALGWSISYLRRLHRLMKRGKVGRKWPTVVDLLLWALVLGMADTTLGTRTSSGSCGPNRDVGGCDPTRRGIMIAAGVLGILLAVSIQFRWIMSCHAARERKRVGVGCVRQEEVQGGDRGDAGFIR